MINEKSLKDMLVHLEFEENQGVYSKYFLENDAYLKVDFNKRELIYPEDKGLTINERQTCNFSDNENFVVFECVHRLLKKGYNPRHIELEPKWKLGHGASGGRADILIKNNLNKALLIIECKTAGNAFNDEWKKTLQNGGQLFSYAQQQLSTEFVCLYTSDFVNGALVYTNHIITLKDNEKLLDDNKDKELFKFRDAEEVEDLYKAWKETYQSDYSTKGIFEDDIQAYHIGKLSFNINDLNPVGSKDIQSKYHEFATILRQYNVSGRENAFDKLVNLFLCKIVDETKNPSNLKFYWKGVAYDSYFELQDRLQKLYQAGMKDFLGEDVTYIDNKQIDEAFKFFKNDPDATKDTIKNYFRQLKFFTNNDFAFIDVHNERLFYHNATILLKVVQMLQDIQLKSDNQNQFLGDLFEGFLDQGIKQSEGQFFTPMPITKFILMSLPLEELIRESEQIPKAIDYACGAGHFLNELALEIKPFVEKYKRIELKDYYGNIYGIEKEYRLSKVSKVSAFMYGQDEIKIIYGDALAENNNIQNGTFSILVANPPYSVKGFLETLSKEDRKKFDLSEVIDEKSISKNGFIEAFFIERAKQLMQSEGIAGIIVPSSIISNCDSSVYFTIREIILKYFDIISIVELGNNTFGKTGTNTIILFLRRRKENPSSAEHYENRVNSWFNNDDKQIVFEDEYFIKKYCEHIKIAFDDYRTLLQGNPSNSLLSYNVFKEYRNDFNNSTYVKNVIKRKRFINKTEEEQKNELDELFLKHIKNIEKEKIYYFTLATLNNQKVVIVKSPTDTKEQKKFLGYEWSGAKGSEGIKLITDEKGKHFTPMYDPEDRYNIEKINYYIYKNFIGEEFTIPEQLKEYVSTANLTDMIDFERKDFTKQISLSVKKESLNFNSKWNLEKLGKIVKINESSANPSKIFGEESFTYIDIASVENGTGKIYLDNIILPKDAPSRARRIIKKDDILISTVRPYLKAFAIVGKLPDRVLASTGFAVLHANKSILNPKYLYELLFLDLMQVQMIDKMGKGQYPSINQNDIENFKIPLPPLEIQAQIVTECENIDSKYNAALEVVLKNEKEIKKRIRKVIEETSATDKIGNVCVVSSGGTPSRSNKEYWTNGTIPWLKSEVCKGSYVTYANEFITEEGLKNSSAKYFDVDTTLIALVGATKGKTAYLTFKATTNQNIAGIYSKDEQVILNKFLFLVCREMYEELIKDLGQYDMLNLTQIKNISIPVPYISIQEELIKEINVLEEELKSSQCIINECSTEKEKIILKYI